MSLNQGFPKITAPLVDENGNLEQPWLQFFINLWNRTGGNQNQVVTGASSSNGVSTSVSQVNNSFQVNVGLGNITPGTVAATGTVTGSNLSGNNSGDVTLAGDNYISLAGQLITARNINLGTQVTGNLSTSNLPSSGISVTITTAQLSSGGTSGSMTFTNGLLTAQVAAT